MLRKLFSVIVGAVCLHLVPLNGGEWDNLISQPHEGAPPGATDLVPRSKPYFKWESKASAAVAIVRAEQPTVIGGLQFCAEDWFFNPGDKMKRLEDENLQLRQAIAELRLAVKLQQIERLLDQRPMEDSG